MPEWLGDALKLAEPYWPFLVKVVTFWWVGQNMKKRVFTKARAARGGAWAFGRASMWLHPMTAGAVWGLLFPWMPAVAFITTRGGAVTEGILAGVASTAGFMALEKIAEARKWTWVLSWLHEAGRPTVAPDAPDEDT